MYDMKNDIKFEKSGPDQDQKHHDQLKESYFKENTD